MRGGKKWLGYLPLNWGPAGQQGTDERWFGTSFVLDFTLRLVALYGVASTVIVAMSLKLKPVRCFPHLPGCSCGMSSVTQSKRERETEIQCSLFWGFFGSVKLNYAFIKSLASGIPLCRKALFKSGIKSTF